MMKRKNLNNKYINMETLRTIHITLIKMRQKTIRFKHLLIMPFLFLLVFDIMAQLPDISVRFANPSFDCVNQTYCLDVEFQSNTPSQQLYGMNVRFFYDDNILEFISFGDFQGGYGPFSPNPPVITTGNPNIGPSWFGISGTPEFLNGAVQLINSTATPIDISTTGWTKLYNVCFDVVDPTAFVNNNFCPTIIWDLEEDPSNGGYLQGIDGVVITVVNPDPNLESAPANELVVQYNWQYDGIAGEPFGFPVNDI